MKAPLVIAVLGISLLAQGCGDETSDNREQEPTGDRGDAAENRDGGAYAADSGQAAADSGIGPPEIRPGGGKGPETIDDATWHDVWRECAGREQAQCATWERCAFWADLKVSTCVHACSTIDDCVDIDMPEGRDFSGPASCEALPGSSLEEGAYCVLKCGEPGSECGLGRICSQGVCVWSDPVAP